jgi:hypothetical protein
MDPGSLLLELVDGAPQGGQESAPSLVNVWALAAATPDTIGSTGVPGRGSPPSRLGRGCRCEGRASGPDQGRAGSSQVTKVVEYGLSLFRLSLKFRNLSIKCRQDALVA